MRPLRLRRALVSVTASLALVGALISGATSATATPADTGVPAASVRAATPGSFDPGLIISDFNFFNGWAMTESEIQAFLDSHISGGCQNSLCLNVLKVDTPTRTWSFGDCATYQGAPAESAARIIFKVQRACGVSARVILVTLQKEQGLVTRTDVTDGILRKAMGFGCPDTSSCDSTFYGFFNQVFAAARQLTWYGNPGGSFTWFKVGQVNAIQYHPDAACGAGNVLLQNRATAALYYYTPYQPNAAALAAWPGASSDPCASYGNRNFYAYYLSWFGDPKTQPSPVVQRLAGSDRWETAAAISRSSFPNAGVPVAYIASGSGFADALSAGPAAAAQGGPVLLVDPGYVPSATMTELRRLKPARIIIVGETPSVSAAVATSLGALAPVTRIGGADRYETSRKVAASAFPTATTAYLATGLDFPDALAASAAGGAVKAPVLLVNGRVPQLDDVTAATLKQLGVGTVKVLGGPTTVAPEISTALTNLGLAVTLFAGVDRVHTSYLVNKDAFPAPTSAYLATGLSFPDALAGAAAAAKAGAPLLVTMPWCVSAEVRSYVKNESVTSITMLGGTPSLPDSLAYLPVC